MNFQFGTAFKPSNLVNSSNTSDAWDGWDGLGLPHYPLAIWHGNQQKPLQGQVGFSISLKTGRDEIPVKYTGWWLSHPSEKYILVSWIQLG